MPVDKQRALCRSFIAGDQSYYPREGEPTWSPEITALFTCLLLAKETDGDRITRHTQK